MSKRSKLILIAFLACIMLVALMAFIKTEQNNRIQTISIGFIGDSITNGHKSGKDDNAVDIAITIINDSEAGMHAKYKAVNCGINQTDTRHWAENDFNERPIMDDTLAKLKTAKVKIVHIMLGTNDAKIGAHRLPEEYGKYLRTIIDVLSENGIETIVISYPIWFEESDNRDQLSQELLFGYQSIIDSTVKQEWNICNLYIGDTNGYDEFKENPSWLIDKTHPSGEGYEELGHFWAEALENVLSGMGD